MRVHSACRQWLGAMGDAGLATTDPVNDMAEIEPCAIMVATVPVLAGQAGDGQHRLFSVCAEKQRFQ